MNLAYCPWCGAELSKMAVTDTHMRQELLWEQCRTRLCKGIMLTLVTDFQGFVIHPYRIRGYYVGKPPKMEKKHGRTTR